MHCEHMSACSSTGRPEPAAVRFKGVFKRRVVDPVAAYGKDALSFKCRESRLHPLRCAQYPLRSIPGLFNGLGYILSLQYLLHCQP